MCPERMPRGDRRRQRTGSRSARADDGNRNGRRERRSHTRSGCNPVPGRSSAIFIDKRTATEVRVLKRRSRTGTCSKRRPGATTCPRSDLVLHPSHKIAGLESTPGSACAEPPPPAGDTAPTRVLKSGGAIVCRPYGTRGWRDAGVPTTEVVGYFLSSLRDSMRTRRSSCCLSSLTGLHSYGRLISFVPDGTQCGHAADLRSNLPATQLRRLRSRSEDAWRVRRRNSAPCIVWHMAGR